MFTFTRSNFFWEPKRKLIEHQCCNLLTAVKTRYPLTRSPDRIAFSGVDPSRLSTFWKLSAEKLLVFKWSQAQVYFFKKFILNILCVCHYGPSLLKGLCHDSAHVWALTVADCFLTNRKRVRCTPGNLHNSRFIVCEERVVFVRFQISHIYSLVFLRYMLQPIRIRLKALSCFETNIYLRVFSRTHASKPVSDR